MDVTPPAVPPMGRLDAFDIGSKKLTVQTEFLSRPTWKLETKVYLGGELKKIHTHDLTGAEENSLQKTLDAFHDAKMKDIVAGLKKIKS